MANELKNTARIPIAADTEEKFSFVGGLAQVMVQNLGTGDVTFQVSIDGGTTWLDVMQDAADPPVVLTLAADGVYAFYMPRGYKESDGPNDPLLRAKLVGGTIAQVETITTRADVGSDLDRKSFTMYDNAGSVGVWIDVGNTGSAIPAAAAAADRAIEVTGVAANDTDAAVATAVASSLNADSKFSASAAGNVITVTHADAGDRLDGEDVDTGFTFAVTTDGADCLVLIVPQPTEA